MKSNKLWIVLDIDDTVTDFVSHLCHIHNTRNKTQYCREDLLEWRMPQELKDTFKKYEEYLYVSAPALPRVKDKISQLKKKGYGILLMTARDEDFRKQTEFNLDLNGIQYDELFFNKNKALKINRLSEEYDIVIFADDKVSTVNKVKERTDVKKVYIINMPSNKNSELLPGIVRINNLNEIEEEN